MRAAIRKLGNSSGVIIPKSMLAQVGIAAGDAVDLSLEDRRIIITPQKKRPREGWAEAFREIADAGDDALVWPEFANNGDADLTWRGNAAARAACASPVVRFGSRNLTPP